MAGRQNLYVTVAGGPGPSAPTSAPTAYGHQHVVGHQPVHQPPATMRGGAPDPRAQRHVVDFETWQKLNAQHEQHERMAKQQRRASIEKADAVDAPAAKGQPAPAAKPVAAKGLANAARSEHGRRHAHELLDGPDFLETKWVPPDIDEVCTRGAGPPRCVAVTFNHTPCAPPPPPPPHARTAVDDLSCVAPPWRVCVTRWAAGAQSQQRQDLLGRCRVPVRAHGRV